MRMTEPTGTLGSEDAKLVTLARFAQGRFGASESAAVRDVDGRTYAGVSVDLPSLQLSALQVCVAMAVSSGARGLEAGVVLAKSEEVREQDLSAIRDLAGTGVPLHRCAPSGALAETLES